MTDLMITRLEDKSEKVRAKAAFRLANCQDDKVIHALLRALEDPSPKVRRQAAYALSTIAPISALEQLVNSLQETDIETCRRIALTLGKIGHPDAVPHLISLFSREDIELHYAAQRAIIRIGEPSIPVLIDLYESPNPRMRAFAVQTLGRIGDKQAIEVFIRALKDPDKWIRWMTASIACSMPDKRFVEPLVDCLDDEFMRWNAAWALGYVGDKKTIKILSSIANDPKRDKVLRSKAEYAIKHIHQRE